MNIRVEILPPSIKVKLKKAFITVVVVMNEVNKKMNLMKPVLMYCCTKRLKKQREDIIIIMMIIYCIFVFN